MSSPESQDFLEASGFEGRLSDILPNVTAQLLTKTPTRCKQEKTSQSGQQTQELESWVYPETDGDGLKKARAGLIIGVDQFCPVKPGLPEKARGHLGIPQNAAPDSGGGGELCQPGRGRARFLRAATYITFAVSFRKRRQN